MLPKGAYRQELIIQNKCYRSFKKQHQYLIENGEELYNNIFLYGLSRYGKGWSSLDQFFRDMGVYDMIDGIVLNVQKVTHIGYKRGYRVFRSVLKENGIEYSINNPALTEYVNNFRTLHLSDAKGSISLTTKNNVVQILKDGLANNKSYTEVAKEIEGLDSFLFSKTRAKLIATREMGKAYEYANYVPMKELHDSGIEMEKEWSTVKDDRVTEECNHNETQGRVPFNYLYMYDGDDIAPRSGNPRCRCTMKYRQKPTEN